MTLTRYQIRNEYGLADKKLYHAAANKEDPEALFECASMAGLVGVLRQLGDLAEFAAEVFHCMHQQLLATAARGHALGMRLQQLEAQFPSFEIPILSQLDHSTFFYDPGLDWHSYLQTKENLISLRNLPPCIMDSYEECRGPPQLFLLDKFDVAGSGSCLKRYSDPSLLKTRTASAVIATSKLSKDETPPKSKKKGSHTTSKETPGDSRTSHAKLHQLFFLEHVENGHRNPDFHVKLKRRQLNGPPINSSSSTSYMERFLENYSPYYEKVHGTLDQSSPAMETEIMACSIQEDLPIPSLVYPNSGDTRKYNEMEIESIADGERLAIPFVPHEITVNKKTLTNIEGGPTICLERSSSLNLCCKANNDTNAPASTESEAKEADSEDNAGYNLGFPGFSQTQICPNAELTQTEVLAQFCNVLHQSLEEGESKVSCTNIQRSSPVSKPHKAEGSAVKVDVSFSQMTPDIYSASMRILELEQTPFSLSCYENPANLLDNSESRLELQSNKANAEEIGLKSFEACEVFEVRRDRKLNISPETHPEYLLNLTQVQHDAPEGGTKVLLTKYIEDDRSQHVSIVETASEISLSALVEDQLAPITNQEIEALEPEDISSEPGQSVPDSKSSLKETSAVLESAILLPNQYISTFDSFQYMSMAADAHDNVVPKEGETNSRDGSSSNTEQSANFSTSDINSENETLMSDTPRDLHTGYGNLSASSCREDTLANPDLAEISSDSGQEDPQTMSIVADDSSEPEVPIPDTQRHSTCFTSDVVHDKQIGLNKTSETMPKLDLENNKDAHESLLCIQECLSPEYCIQPHDQGQESSSETGSANPITASAEFLPTQDGLVGVQGSPSEEALTCNEKLFPSSITEIEALHAPHQETFTSLNDHISESILPMDLVDEEYCLDVSSKPMVPFSTSLHETPKANAEITPPLPPLPPTQWWMRKLVESNEMQSLAGSQNNSFYIHRDVNTRNGLVQATETQYQSEVTVTDGEDYNSHDYIEGSRGEAVSSCAQTTLNEPSKATKEQSPAAVNGTRDTYKHNNESTTLKSLNKTVEASFAEEVSVGDTDWRTEAMALEWFSQNLRGQTNTHHAKLEEESQLDHPLEPPGAIEFLQTLQYSNSYDIEQETGNLKRDEDSLVIGVDRNMLRKVSERNMRQVGARVDENDSLLEIIRSKSFNLRPTNALGRPNFQVVVPKTNLKVAAILEKANTLRQAMVGSDDEHDLDSWSE